MTGILKFLTIGLWILILTLWIGDLKVGIPVYVSDYVTSGIVEPTSEHSEEVTTTRRALTALALIPVLVIFGVVI